MNRRIGPGSKPPPVAERRSVMPFDAGRLNDADRSYWAPVFWRVGYRSVAGGGNGTAKNYKKETDVKNYLLLHYGFENPTPEEMGA